MPQLIKTVPTEEPLTTIEAERDAQRRGLKQFPLEDTDTELIILPPWAEIHIVRSLAWKGPRPQEAPRRAVWNYWRQHEQVELWQGILLSLDVDPRLEPDNGLSGEHAIDTFDASLGWIQARNRHRVRERLGIAENCLRGSLKTIRHAPKFMSTVDFQVLGTWAKTKDWQLPDDFPRLAEVPKDEPKAKKTKSAKPVIGVTITLPYVTKRLEALFKIMRKNWTNYDPKNPPKQTNIASEIDKAMGWSASSKDGKPSRNGDALATVIRPTKVRDADPRAKRRGSG